jgi:ankyrin repeat protein
MFVPPVAPSARVVQLLLNRGADKDARDSAGNTPLLEAIRQGNDEVTRALIEAGCKLDVQNSDGDSIAHLAAREGRDLLLRFINRSALDASEGKTGINVDLQNKEGDTALHVAQANGNSNVIAVLKQLGAKEDVKNNKGKIWSAVEVKAAAAGAGGQQGGKAGGKGGSNQKGSGGGSTSGGTVKNRKPGKDEGKGHPLRIVRFKLLDLCLFSNLLWNGS